MNSSYKKINKNIEFSFVNIESSDVQHSQEKSNITKLKILLRPMNKVSF